MKPAEILKLAWDAVKAAGLPDHLEEVAFREAVRLVSPPHGVDVSSPGIAFPEPSAQIGGAIAEVRPAFSEADVYSRVSQQTGVAREHLEGVVHMDGDSIKVSVPGLKLGKTNADRARAVAQILVITRGFGFEESDTPLEVIRDECDRLRLYDANNFSSQMKALVGYVITGTGASRRVRAKAAGIQAFPALVNSLVNE